MDNPTEAVLVGDNGACGTLRINIIPTDSSGTVNLSEELDE